MLRETDFMNSGCLYREWRACANQMTGVRGEGVPSHGLPRWRTGWYEMIDHECKHGGEEVDWLFG
jgi:hypothetical protein